MIRKNGMFYSKITQFGIRKRIFFVRNFNIDGCREKTADKIKK